jgi:hypothetical protein
VRRAAADGIAALRRTYPALADHDGVADDGVPDDAADRASRRRVPSGARSNTTGGRP